jgi:hypothetical protein
MLPIQGIYSCGLGRLEDLDTLYLAAGAIAGMLTSGSQSRNPIEQLGCCLAFSKPDRS